MVTQQESNACSVLLPLLILGLPILDTLSVIAIRLFRGRFIFSPDRSHLHHQLMRAGFFHYEAVAALYVLQFILMVVLYQLRFESDLVLLVAYAIFCSLVLAFVGWARISGWQLHVSEGASVDRERRHRWIRNIPYLHEYSTNMVEWSVALFLIAVGVGISSTSLDIKIMTIMLATALGVYWVVFRSFSFSPRLVVRFSIYATCLLVVYLLWNEEASRPVFGTIIDVYLAVLVVLLLLAIRTTRKALFRLNNQDYLVMVLVLLTPVLPLQSSTGVNVGHFAFRALVLLYACEFVISKRPGMQPVLFGGSIACLLGIGLF